MKNNSVFKRSLSFILAFVMVFGMIPITMTVSADSSAVTLQTSSGVKTADPSTMDDWTKYFGPDRLTTENAGGVWTDKSVFINADAFAGTGITMSAQDSFLIALSAIASNLTVEGMSYVPTDTILVLDVSGSMDEDRNALADEMVEAANDSIAKLLADNKYNRVGVVLYSSSSTVLLPLGRYSTSQNGNYLDYTNPNYGTEYISINQNVVIEGTNQKPSGNNSESVTGATYIQSGVLTAMEQFVAESNETSVTDPVLGTLNRIPVMVIMSDGAPTYGSTDFTGLDSRDLGNGSDSEAYLGFVSQLSIAYAKSKIDDKYGESLVYTLGLGVGNDSVAKSVLDPANTSTAIEALWTEYNSAEVGGTVKIHTANQLQRVDDNTPGGYGKPGGGKPEYEWVSVDYYVTKTADTLNQKYVDAHFAVDGTSAELSAGLLNAFEDIVKRIEIQSRYFPTLVEQSEHLSGYVSFVDKIGRFMEVTDVKGMLINNTLYSGKSIASHFTADGGDLGTLSNPTALGTAFFNSVVERFNITEDEAKTLIELAYNHKQLYYDTETGEYSNYIGWYANAAGEFLGFWYDGITTMPDPSDPTLTDKTRPAQIIKSYGYLGAVDEAHGVDSSDMMYATIRVIESIETGDQTVAFAIPASLIPTVTYNVSLDDAGELVELEVTGAEHPIRFVYEVALDDRINELNVKNIVGEDYYHITADGDYEFFTNKWDHDLNIAYGTNNTYSYFRPSTENDRYYYTSDSVIFTDENGTPYSGDTAPSSGTFYRSIKVYAKNGSFTTKTVYEQISSTSLAKATRHDDGYWYIPAGTVHTFIENFDTEKTANNTNTIKYSDKPFVDSEHTYYVGATLGNNGRITLTPATGIKIEKAIDELNTDPDANTTFEFTVTNTSNTQDSSEYKAYYVDSEGKTTETSVKLTAGSASVTLKDGDALYIVGLNAGDTFLIEETETAYYKVASVNGDSSLVYASLTARDKDILSASFINTAKGKGNLTIAKEIEHDFGTSYQIPDGKVFTITVTLSGAGVNGEEFRASHSGNSELSSVTVSENGVFEVALKNGEKIELFDLPEGTKVSVLESDPGAGFTAYYYENGVLGDGELAIEAGATASVEVVNDYASKEVYPVNITVSGTKTLTGREWLAEDSFTFKLQKWNASTSEWSDLAEATVKGSDNDKSFDFSGGFASERYTETGIYYYRVVEVEGNVDGIIYDTTVHSFSVIVTDTDMDGQLEISEVNPSRDTVKVDETNGVWAVSADFTNVYDVQSVAASIDINKIVTNASLSPLASLAGFKFELYDNSGNLVATSEATTDRGFARLNLTFEEKGTFTYTLKEIIPATLPAGWNYSTAVITVTAEITDSANGNLAAALYIGNEKPENASATLSVSFTNEYAPEKATLELNVSKNLIGRDLVAGEFDFEIRNEADGTLVASGKNDADGKVVFDKELTFNTVGVYYYNVLETTADGIGITTDKTVYKVIITVVDNAGELSASYVVANTADNSIVFTNTYKTTSVKHTVSGTKVLTGRVLLNSEFTFALVPCDENGTPLAGATAIYTSNFSNGKFNFDAIEFTESGVYRYLVTEVEDSTSLGIVYDKTKYTVTVKVSDNGKGALVIDSVEYAKVGGDKADAIVFNNVYSPKPVDADIAGTKRLEGKVLTDGDFVFELYRSNENKDLVELLATVANGNDGSFSFDSITFDSTGSYYYIVKEQNGGQTIDGIIYDPNVFFIVVDVRDELKGELKASVTVYDAGGVPKESIIFTNTYAIVENATAVIEGKKILEGRDLKGGDFYFLLKDESGKTVSRVSNEMDGSFRFEELVFTEAGTYVFTVSEENLESKGILYDTGVYTVTVNVTDNGKGALVAEVTGGEDIVFVNVYKASALYIDFLGKKILQGRELKEGEFTFVLIDEQGKVLRTVKNKADGSFEFPFIKFDKAGTFKFTVKEIAGNLGGITYDTGERTFIVTITDDGNGNLKIKTKGLDDIVFTNVYSAKEAKVSISAKKTISGRDLNAGEFSFVLKDEDGNAVETVQNAADGSISFSALTFTEAGTYVYTVSEISGLLGGVTYDERVYTVEINVTDDGEGNLIASVKGADDILFENSYSAKETEVEFSAEKELIGGELDKGDFLFELKDENGAVIETVENGADGSISFSAITFTEPGIYTYTVSEVIGNDENVTYDTSVYVITVVVTDKGVGKLFAELDGAIGIRFVNTYTPEETTEVPEETTEAPEETTEAPEETTETPEETTEAPEETTEAPEETTEVPEETTEAPEETTEAPEETTETPEETTEAPEETTVPEETTSPEETTEPSSPTTGDSTGIHVWIGAIIIALCVGAVTMRSKKREIEE